jgi:ribosomal protein L7/L12
MLAASSSTHTRGESKPMETTVHTKCTYCGGQGIKSVEVPAGSIAILVAMMADSDHRKIEAIKFLRASVPTRLGLKEAKDYVEDVIMPMSARVINNTWSTNGWKKGY